MKSKFEASFEGHNVDRKGFSKITFKASHTELKKTLRLGMMIGSDCIVDIDFAGEDISVMDGAKINGIRFDRDGECKVVFESDEIIDDLTSNLEGLLNAVFILKVEVDDTDE